MQNNKPILALSPSVGVINDMYRKQEIDYFADVTNPRQIADTLDQIYSDFEGSKVGLQDKNIDLYGNKEVASIHFRQIFNV